jgi:hypothetical protein
MSDTLWVKKSRVSALARQRDDIPSRWERACYDDATTLCTTILFAVVQTACLLRCCYIRPAFCHRVAYSLLRQRLGCYDSASFDHVYATFDI